MPLSNTPVSSSWSFFNKEINTTIIKSLSRVHKLMIMPCINAVMVMWGHKLGENWGS